MYDALFTHGGLSLDRLKSFIEVVAAGSITGAADRDPVRQSMYSRQIKDLESFFGVKLFERVGRGLKPTAQGLELARVSRYFFMALSQLKTGFSEINDTISIAGDSGFLNWIVLPRLSRLIGEDRDLVLHTLTLPWNSIVNRLNNLELHFGIIPANLMTRRLVSQPLFQTKFCLYHQLDLDAVIDQYTSNEFTPVGEDSKVICYAGCNSNARLLRGKVVINGFHEAYTALRAGLAAAVLPDMVDLVLEPDSQYNKAHCSGLSKQVEYVLAWNPRMANLNPRLADLSDRLADQLSVR